MYQLIDLRLAIRLPVRLLSYADDENQQILLGVSRNISFTGLFVEINDIILPDKRLVHIHIFSESCGELELSGFVIRHEIGGIGIVFDHYNIDASERLGTIMSLHFDNAKQRSKYIHEVPAKMSKR
jgi:hypothetical protein